MRVSARALNRSTLRRQLLLERAALPAAEVVRRAVAVQAQQPPSPYIALWNRIRAFDPAELDAAFLDRSVVKATLMRITLHAVHVDDYAAFRAAMLPTLRAAGLNDRFTASGLTVEDADAMVPELLAFMAEPRTHAEIGVWLEGRLGRPAPGGVWRGMRAIAPLVHATGRPPWSFGDRPSYLAAAQLATADASPDRALEVLVRRYLEGFGPATIADVARFALVPRARVKAAVEALDDGLVRLVGPGGAALFDVPGNLSPDVVDVPAPPRLLPMWDSVLLAFDDRSRVVPEAYRTIVARSNGDVLPTILVDGRVAGVWRPAEGGIECTAFRRLRPDAWEGLAQEAAGLTAFLADRDPDVYRRYGHWWSKLEGAQVRVLPGA